MPIRFELITAGVWHSNKLVPKDWQRKFECNEKCLNVSSINQYFQNFCHNFYIEKVLALSNFRFLFKNIQNLYKFFKFWFLVIVLLVVYYTKPCTMAVFILSDFTFLQFEKVEQNFDFLLTSLQITGLGNTRGFYCNSNSGGSELQGIGHFLSPQELYWKELVRSSKAQKRIDKCL